MRSTAIVIALCLCWCAAACSGDRAQRGERADEAPPAPVPASPAASPAVPEVAMVAGFTPPHPAVRRLAIGLDDGADGDAGAGAATDRERRVYADHRFAAISAPGPGDWLAEHTERGQTFHQYLGAEPNRPTQARQTLYLLPIGALDPARSPPMAVLAAYTEAYFGLPVTVLPAITVDETKATTRVNPSSGQRQLLSTDLLVFLRRRIPRDAYALIGLTQIDLYPDPAWNFVFGQASLSERVGVYSFARYAGEEPDDALIVSRSLKVMAHEIGHMIGIEHCVWFQCVMNGSNHMDEADAQPHHLCPVDLRKLIAITGADPVMRYRRLRAFYAEHGLDRERAWIEERLTDIGR